MQTITLLHADHYTAAWPGASTGFEGVRFPVRVQAEPYRYGENGEFSMDTLMIVPNHELTRIGYTGPMLPGGLNFGRHNKSFRANGPFDFWNALKASRNVGELPA